ncbi:MAG: DUF2103 domain-containing protein [bacterium]|nr:DUF2103 domain-containing protein [bacterium]
MPKHAVGGKINHSHTTIIDAVQKVLVLTDKLPEVSKISLGKITAGLPTGIHRLKCIPITGGLRVEIRGTSSKQQIFVYTSNPKKTEKELIAGFS